jgi:predicted O-methyltransferase YrrM
VNITDLIIKTTSHETNIELLNKEFFKFSDGAARHDRFHNVPYNNFDLSGVECEVGEFLYSLTRMIKPSRILETGTSTGISTAYFGLGLLHNNFGTINTIDPGECKEANQLIDDLNINHLVTFTKIHAENYSTEEVFDIAFLDSEPKLRFNEFIKFYDNVVPGGIILIHDLNRNMGSVENWGNYETTLGGFIKDEKIQIFSFWTPRGLVMFQKPHPENNY